MAQSNEVLVAKRSEQIESLRRLRSSLLTPPSPRRDVRAPDAPPAHEGARSPVVHHHHLVGILRERKSLGLAYVLWLLIGGLGVHRFYLGRTGSGIAMLLLAVLGWLPLFLGWAVLGIWWLVDAILMPGMARDANDDDIRALR